jgi:hypothetical protein
VVDCKKAKVHKGGNSWNKRGVATNRNGLGVEFK